MWALANVLSGTARHPTSFHAVKYIVSHDERRVVDEVNRAGSSGAKAVGGIPKAKLGAVALFTAAGIPMFYMGEEIGEDDYTPDNPAPNPVDWAQGNAGVRATYRNLIALRLTHPSLATGGIEFRGPSWGTGEGPCQQDKIVNYWRYAGTDANAADLVVAANFDHADHKFAVAFPASGTWYRWDPETGQTVSVDVVGGALPVTLPASTAFLYVKDLAVLP
jgi:1,4-alpha-glucan branching enzyme